MLIDVGPIQRIAGDSCLMKRTNLKFIRAFAEYLSPHWIHPIIENIRLMSGSFWFSAICG
jgi:hypothetical protein